jgi:hypothetical protein
LPVSLRDEHYGQQPAATANFGNSLPAINLIDFRSKNKITTQLPSSSTVFYFFCCGISSLFIDSLA